MRDPIGSGDAGHGKATAASNSTACNFDASNSAGPSDAGAAAEPMLREYHQSLLGLYALQRDPDAAPAGLSLDSLGTDHCPQWRQAVDRLPVDRELLLSLGPSLQQQLRFGELLALSRWLVEVFPGDAQLTHNLGVLLMGLGDRAQAEDSLRRACQLDPEREDSALQLAALLGLSDPEAALAILRSLEAKGPPGFDLGLALFLFQVRQSQNDSSSSQDRLPGRLQAQLEGRPERFTRLLGELVAAGALPMALSLAQDAPPGCGGQDWEAELLATLGVSRAGGLDAEAARFCQRMATDRSEDPRVRLALAKLELAVKNHESAETWLRPLIEVAQPSSEALDLLAGALIALGRLAEARNLLQRCLRDHPLVGGAHSRLGMVNLVAGEVRGALDHFRVSLRLAPRCGMGFLVLGNLLRLTGDLPTATDALRRAWHHCPHEARAGFSLATALLQQGHYAEGWALYDTRLDPRIVPLQPPIGMARWDGQTPIDELILVAEQGVGDLIQFMRYAPFLGLAIPRVSILAERKMESLLQRFAGFSAVYSYGDTIRYQGKAAWLPLLSVPALLGITAESILIDAPYLRAEPEAIQRWRGLLRQNLPATTRLVALNWQGNPTSENLTLMGRSFPLEVLAPLADLEDLRFVSVQKGAGSEQLEACSFRDRFIDAQASVSDCWDFAETAAILACCDLVISSDTAVAHLAGALGLPTWLLLQHIPEWRWGLEGESTPWYSSLRLFRQPSAGDWPSVVAAVRRALSAESSS